MQQTHSIDKSFSILRHRNGLMLRYTILNMLLFSSKFLNIFVFSTYSWTHTHKSIQFLQNQVRKKPKKYAWTRYLLMSRWGSGWMVLYFLYSCIFRPFSLFSYSHIQSFSIYFLCVYFSLICEICQSFVFLFLSIIPYSVYQIQTLIDVVTAHMHNSESTECQSCD